METEIVDMEAELIELITNLLRELGEDPDIRLPDRLDADTVLLGDEGCLDSLALVLLVVGLEEAIEDQYDEIVKLADEKAFSQKHSPYRTIRSLADFAAKVIKGK